LLPWKPEANKAITVMAGTMNFTQVTTRLTRTNSWIPNQLSTTSTASRAAATPMPPGDREVPW
jgi:hypothetical protein